MTSLNNYNGERISEKDIARSKQAASNKKLLSRIKYGFISLVKSPFKAFIALAYVAGVIMLYMQREHMMNGLIKDNIWRFIAQTFPKAFRGIFIYGIPAAAILIFLLLMIFFGFPLGWVGKSFITAGKAENAFLSAGIYTRTGKLPWLLSLQQTKDTPSKKICEIYLNGNAKSEFEDKAGNLESELGVTIDNFEEKSKQIILMSVYPGNFPKHRKVPEDPLFRK